MQNRAFFLDINLLLGEPWKNLLRKYGGDGASVFSLIYLMAERDCYEVLSLDTVLKMVSYTLCLDAEFVGEIIRFCVETGLLYRDEFERGELLIKGDPLSFLDEYTPED